MRCDDVRERLSAFLDAALDPRERAEVERHILACAACRGALGRLERLSRALNGVTAPAVPDGLAARVMARAASRPTAARVRWTPIRWWRTTPLAVRAAAAALLAVGATLGALAGNAMARPAAPASLEARTAPAEPVAALKLDTLSNTPSGSLAEAYVTLASAQTGKGQ